MEKNDRVRNLIVVVNNWKKRDVKLLTSLVATAFRYLLIGYEVGESGTPHLQCYIELRDQWKFGALLELLPGFHLEKRRGTQQQAIDYITNNPKKPDPVFEEYGKKKKAGQRTDLAKFGRVAAKHGIREVVSRSPNYQQLCFAEKVLRYIEVPRNKPPEVTWIWGESERGKTRRAYELCGDNIPYKKAGKHKWFDGYDRHSHAILDDVKHSWFDHEPLPDLLCLLDRYPYSVEIKGGFRQWVPDVIIVTSIHHPEEFDSEAGELVRRIHKIIHME